jgi:hypothetical protein
MNSGSGMNTQAESTAIPTVDKKLIPIGNQKLTRNVRRVRRLLAEAIRYAKMGSKHDLVSLARDVRAIQRMGFELVELLEKVDYE